MSAETHKTFWVTLNALQLRLLEVGTGAVLEEEPELAAWADKASTELLPFLHKTRRYHHGSQAPS